MLAYYVQWHMMERLAPMLFAEEDADAARRLPPIIRPTGPNQERAISAEIPQNDPFTRSDLLLFYLEVQSRRRLCMTVVYDAEHIRKHIAHRGHVPIIDTNPRNGKAKHIREKKARRAAGFVPPEQVRY